MSILDALRWRYAAKKLKKEIVSDENITNIVEAARLAPTSSGLQPFEIFVITNQELKNEIRKVSFDQSQVSDCSHLIIFAAWDHYALDRINHYFDFYEKERDLEKGFSDGYKIGVTKQLTAMSVDRQFEHAAKQVYIAFAFAMAEAAVLKIDTSPMEGFLPTELDEILDFKAKGLKSVLMLPVGYRDETTDWQVNLKKVRKTPDFMVHYIK